MSRYFMLQSWVGSHENEPDYNGQQCGERNVRSIECVPLYDQFGNANVSAFSDEAIAARKQQPKKPSRSIVEKILPQQVRYDNLCNLMTELESQQGSMDTEDYYQYHAILKAKIDRQWLLLSKAAGWTEHLSEKPSTNTPTKSIKTPVRQGKITPKNNDKVSTHPTLQPSHYRASEGENDEWRLVKEKLKNYLKSDFTRLFGSASIVLVAYLVLNTYF